MIWLHDFFRTEINLIQSDEIKQFTEWFLDNKMPKWFWESRASSSGKYHPVETVYWSFQMKGRFLMFVGERYEKNEN